jgi:hypothetical protein
MDISKSFLKQFLTSIVFITTFGFSQTTYVPDDNFEQALIDLGYDDVLDDYVVTANISGVTTLYVESKEIADLMGIEAFTALEELDCHQNQLTSLDVGSNTALTYLQCYANQLTYLNMRNGITDQLSNFNATNNSLTCIETLDLDYATANWTSDNENIDAGVTFSVICGSENQDEWYVATTGSDGGGSGTQESPFATIQTGINASGDGNTVHVAMGTYVENLVFGGKNLSLIGADSSNTIIDGDSVSQVINLNNGEDSTTVIKNFTLRNGTGWEGNGSAILMDGGDYGPKLENLYITQNYDNAITSFGSTFSLKNSRIINNYGRSLSIQAPQLSTIDNVVITGNGEGVEIIGYSTAVFTNVTISNHVSEAINYVVYIRSSTLTFKNTLIVGNKYGIFTENGGSLKMINSNIVSNTGRPLEFVRGGSGTIINSIISNNTNPIILLDGDNPETAANFSYSIIEGGWSSINNEDGGTLVWGSGNIDVNPMFVDTANGNYNLLASSMLINAGHPDSTDSDGTVADIGAYPYLNSYSGPTWYITEAGNDTTATGASDDPFRSIQAALNFGSDDDTAFVSAGTYNENLVYRYEQSANIRSVSLIGENKETTIIDGNQAGIVVDLPNGGSSGLVIEGFTIRNGYADGNMGGYGSFNQGGGIHVGHNYNPLHLNDLIITNCNAVPGGAGGVGGGIFSENSSLEISNVQINNNSAEDQGGGIFFWGAPDYERTLSIVNSNINGNSSGDSGGGLYIAKSPYGSAIPIIQLSNTTVTNNTSGNDGGGVSLNEVNATFENCTVSENTATNGAGINSVSSTVTVNNSSISDNVTGGSGGAIAFWSTTTTLENVDITGNVASVDGGGLYFQNTDPIITDVNISNNSAYSGGGIRFDDQSDATMTNVTISGNVSSWEGGGIYCGSSSPILTNVTISGNTAPVDGGGVYLNNSSPVMSHVTMSGNSCDNHGGGIFMKNNSNPSFSNSVLWNDLPQEIYMEGSGGGGPNNVTINHTNIQGGQDGVLPNDNGTITWGNGNINLNPLFCSTDNNDYTLDSNSPCLGTGLNGDDMGAHGVGCDRIVWHVSTSGSDVDDGNPGSPFASIQEGINAGSDGDTILVEAGTYVEPNVPYYGNGYSAGPNLYEKNNLAIIADPIGSVIIDLDDHNYGFCFSKSSTNNIVDGFTIRNSGSEMITAWNNSSDNTFMNCVFLATDGEDFTYTTYDPGHIILNCTFIGDGTNQTIYNPVEDGAVPTVLNSIIYNYDQFMGSDYVDDIPINNSLFHEVGGTLPTGGDVVYLNPLFCEADSGNYQLAANSPAVGTGINGWNMGALDVGCDDIWLPPIITTTLVDTSIDEDSEFSLWVNAESEQGYWIYGAAFSDTSSVNVMWSDPEMEDLHIVPMSDWNGTALITLVAYCEFDDSAADTASFTLTVNPVDDLPFVDGHIYPRYYSEDFGVDTVAYLPDVFVDIDGELTFSYTFTDSSILTADLSNNHLVLSSIDDISGDTELMITATNPTRASVTDTVQISIWPVNDPPVIDSIPDIVMDEDSEFFFDLSSYINDIDSDEIWVFVDNVSAPMNDYVDMYMDGPDTLRLIAYDNWHGTGTITIIADDGDLSDTEEINVTVNPVNDLPVFENLSALVNVGTEFQAPIHVYDIDMDSLVVSFDDSWTYPEWLSLVYDPHSLVGTAPEPVDIHFPLNLSDGQATVTDTFYLSAAFFNPRVTSVTDVPDDQGGRVYVGFNASFFDNGETTGQSYSLFRYDYFDSDTSGWVALSSVDAIGDPTYTFEATTVMDSTFEGDGMTEFKVVASMSEGIFHSDPMMGYSVDNIAPGVPGGLMATALDEGIHLTWYVSVEEDFQYFILEKSLNSEFQEYETFETIDTSYIDLEYVLNETNYYRLAAVDHAGNVSEYSDLVEAAVLSIDGDLIPEVFALHQNYPNPFNPTTQIRYDLPEDANVNITIYDIMGRVVRTMVNTQQNAGFKSIQWNAANNLGEPVSAGMYIYMIQAGEFRQTKKMVLLK